MPDELDRTQEREAQIDDMNIIALRYKAQTMPVGISGECDLCGEWSGRLVQGVCAPCRDCHGLP